MGKGKVKNKTHKATAKRFKLSASGKVRHFKQGDNSHMKVNKSNKQLNRQEGKTEISNKKEANKLKRLLLK